MIDEEKLALTHRRFRYIYGRLCDLAKEAKGAPSGNWMDNPGKYASSFVTLPTLKIGGSVHHEQIHFQYIQDTPEGERLERFLQEEFRPMWRELVDLLHDK